MDDFGAYDRLGNPISADDWTRLTMNRDYKRVASTIIPESSIWVSTVWLGLDHGWGDAPIIFETMVFGNVDELEDRYSTEEDALAGHVAIVRRLLGPAARNLPVPMNDPMPKRSGPL